MKKYRMTSAIVLTLAWSALLMGCNNRLSAHPYVEYQNLEAQEYLLAGTYKVTIASWAPTLKGSNIMD